MDAFKRLILLLSIACWSSCVLADEQSDKRAAESLMKAFVGGCVQIMPNVNRVEDASKALNWKLLTGDMAKMFAPQDPKADWKAWLVQGAAEVPFIIAISKGQESGKRISVCTVANPYAPPMPVKHALTSLLKLGNPFKTNVNGGQNETYWNYEVNEKKSFIMFVDATPMSDPGMTVSITMIE